MRCDVIAHRLLQLAELSGHALQSHARLLKLLMGSAHQVAVPVRRLASVLQLKV